MKHEKDITPLNNKGKAHGDWVCHYNDGDTSVKCTYNNNVMVGYEIWVFGKSGHVNKTYHIR